MFITDIIKAVKLMKKNVGSRPLLYPLPLVIVGAANGSKPTWTLIAHVGIMGLSRVVISSSEDHFINKVIREKNKLSINSVTRKMLPDADVTGILTGKEDDKSFLFEYSLGDHGLPLITASPVVMECTVENIYKTPGFDNFICTVDAAYAETDYIGADGVVDFSKVDPILFEFPGYNYISMGKVLGKGKTFAK